MTLFMGQSHIEGIDKLWAMHWGIGLQRCWNQEIDFTGMSKGNLIHQSHGTVECLGTPTVCDEEIPLHITVQS